MHEEKPPNKLDLPKQMGKKTVGRPKTAVDESILHGRSWVELFGTSPKRNNGVEGKP